jgi:hypothetical protein
MWTGRRRLSLALIGVAVSTAWLLGFTQPVLCAEGTVFKTAADFIYQKHRTLIIFRPIDYVSSPETARVEALLGRDFGDLNAYLYWKLNSRGRHFLGVRLDYALHAWERRLRAAFQLRGFLGLNPESRDHVYVVTHLTWRLDQSGIWRPGLLEYGIKELGGDAVLYLGPSFSVNPSALWSLRLSYGRDLLNSGKLLYLKLYFYL